MISKIAAEMERAWIGKLPAPFPTDLKPDLTLEEAYRVQDLLSSKLVDPFGAVSGYKVAFTSPEEQRKFGISEPVTGRVFASQAVPEGVSLNSGEYRLFHIETEIAFVVGTAIKTPVESLEELRESVASIHLVFDIADNRFDLSRRPQKITDFVAAGAGAHAYALGPAVHKPFPELDKLELSMSRDGVKLYRGNTATLPEGPWGVFAWMVNHLIKRGITISPHTLFISGKVAPPYKSSDDADGEYIGSADSFVPVICRVKG